MYLSIITLLLILISPNLCEGYSFYHFDITKIKVHPTMISRYVKPQLKTITNEYYQTLKKLHPMNKDLLQLKKMTFKAQVNWKKWYDTCLTLNKTCSQDLKNLHKSQRQIEKLIIQLQNNTFNQQFFFNQFITDSICMIADNLEKLSNLNYSIIHSIEGIQILSIDSKLPFQGKTDFIGNHIHHMQLISERIMTGHLPKKLQEKYSNLWFFYIRDIERYLTYKLDNTFLYSKLETFNLNWNNFHRSLDKGIVKVPSDILKTLKVMHRRWNSVLKIIMKGHKKRPQK